MTLQMNLTQTGGVGLSAPPAPAQGTILVDPQGNVILDPQGNQIIMPLIFLLLSLFLGFSSAKAANFYVTNYPTEPTVSNGQTLLVIDKTNAAAYLATPAQIVQAGGGGPSANALTNGQYGARIGSTVLDPVGNTTLSPVTNIVYFYDTNRITGTVNNVATWINSYGPTYAADANFNGVLTNVGTLNGENFYYNKTLGIAVYFNPSGDAGSSYYTSNSVTDAGFNNGDSQPLSGYAINDDTSGNAAGQFTYVVSGTATNYTYTFSSPLTVGNLTVTNNITATTVTATTVTATKMTVTNMTGGVIEDSGILLINYLDPPGYPADYNWLIVNGGLAVSNAVWLDCNHESGAIQGVWIQSGGFTFGGPFYQLGSRFSTGDVSITGGGTMGAYSMDTADGYVIHTGGALAYWDEMFAAPSMIYGVQNYSPSVDPSVYTNFVHGALVYTLDGLGGTLVNNPFETNMPNYLVNSVWGQGTMYNSFYPGNTNWFGPAYAWQQENLLNNDHNMWGPTNYFGSIDRFGILVFGPAAPACMWTNIQAGGVVTKTLVVTNAALTISTSGDVGVGTCLIVRSNTWSAGYLACITNQMNNGDYADASSNGIPVTISLSNGAATVTYRSTTGGGIVP